METTAVTVKSILTRTTGFLKTVCSHSLQPYRGCPFGKALCGVGCYVRHNVHVTRGHDWGTFLEVRTNAAEAYRSRGAFAIFLSSSTEPFPPQEARLGITRGVLEEMFDQPPDVLIVQTHADHVVGALDVLQPLASRTKLRVHISIESDRDRLPGLPPPSCSVERRFAAAAALRAAGLRVVVTVSPLLPIAEPDRFFERIAAVADAVVLDHFIGGDGSSCGTRTQSTPLPAAMAAVDPASVELSYRDRMAEVARRWLPGRVGFHIEGFADRGWT